MWGVITNIILRNRILIISILLALTGVMAYFGTKVGIDHHLPQLLPNEDKTYQAYENFKLEFGEESSIVVIGYEGDDIYNLQKFQKWQELGNRIKEIQHVSKVEKNGKSIEVNTNAIDSVFSIAHLFNIYKNKSEKRFDLTPIVSTTPQTQKELDSIRDIIESLPFYQDVIYHKDENLNLMLVSVNNAIFNSKERGTLVSDISDIVFEYETYLPGVRISGLPYIRDSNMRKVKGELGIFVALALLVTSLLLLFFFKSLRVMLVALTVVSVGVIWSFGLIGLLDYKITILMGLIPPLIIVIGVPNCIYLINKYQQEYKIHGNKAKALSRVIQKIGNATFLTNATTAMGFATFIFTQSEILRDFGVVSSINIMIVFLLSILIIPIIYSYLSPPTDKQTRHLDKKWLYWVVDKLVSWTVDHRKKVYIVSSIVLLLGLFGLTKMHTTGNIVDDLPQGDKVLVDLQYFEEKLNGVMPFEVIVDAKVKNRIFQDTVLHKIENAQEYLASQDLLSKSLSVVDAIKFLNQSYFGGGKEHYELKSESSLRRVYKYLESASEDEQLGSSFLDSINSKTRISVQVKDVGTKEMERLLGEVEPSLDSIFNPSKKEILALQTELKDATGDKKMESLRTLFETYPAVRSQFELVYFEGNEDSEFELLEDPDAIYNYASDEAFYTTLDSTIDEGFIDINITGTSVVFTKGTNYLISNLFISLLIAIVIIAILMSFLFKSARMVFVSLLPNLIPLVVTGAIMGYGGISIKPSTILVFSIAFGISIDDTIHFLAKYRQELKANNWQVRVSVINSLKEAGISMVYTSIILFFGFSIFAASNFGGTQALGVLVSVTLLVAMLTNLVLLPSLLLSFESKLTKKELKSTQDITIDYGDDDVVEEAEVKEVEETQI